MLSAALLRSPVGSAGQAALRQGEAPRVKRYVEGERYHER